MTLGTPRRRTVFHQNDTAELTAWPNGYDRNPLPDEEIAEVIFSIKDPDGVVQSFPGEVTDEGSGFYRYEGTSQLGVYGWNAQFEFISGAKRTIPGEFIITDPFAATTTPQVQQVADKVWMRLEDMFDSDEGGPWLRDMTMKYFEPSKVEQFVAEGMMIINQTPPMTELDLGYFLIEIPNTDPLFIGETTVSPDSFLVVQATLIAVIKHLIRSYVEQPDVRGANVVFEDRRDYLQRWQSVLQMEEESFRRLLALWKRRFYGFGKSALLVHSKAGRVYRGGSNWRLRNGGRPGY